MSVDWGGSGRGVGDQSLGIVETKEENFLLSPVQFSRLFNLRK